MDRELRLAIDTAFFKLYEDVREAEKWPMTDIKEYLKRKNRRLTSLENLKEYR